MDIDAFKDQAAEVAQKKFRLTVGIAALAVVAAFVLGAVLF